VLGITCRGEPVNCLTSVFPRPAPSSALAEPLVVVAGSGPYARVIGPVAALRSHTALRAAGKTGVQFSGSGLAPESESGVWLRHRAIVGSTLFRRKAARMRAGSAPALSELAESILRCGCQLAIAKAGRFMNQTMVQACAAHSRIAAWARPSACADPADTSRPAVNCCRAPASGRARQVQAVVRARPTRLAEQADLVQESSALRVVSTPACSAPAVTQPSLTSSSAWSARQLLTGLAASSGALAAFFDGCSQADDGCRDDLFYLVYSILF